LGLGVVGLLAAHRLPERGRFATQRLIDTARVAASVLAGKARRDAGIAPDAS